MSMQSYANSGHLVRLTRESLLALGAPEPMIDGFLADTDLDSEPAQKVVEFIREKWGLAPDLINIRDDAEGCDGEADPGRMYLSFTDDDKYIRALRPEWMALPVEPVESSWTTIG